MITSSDVVAVGLVGLKVTRCSGRESRIGTLQYLDPGNLTTEATTRPLQFKAAKTILDKYSQDKIPIENAIGQAARNHRCQMIQFLFDYHLTARASTGLAGAGDKFQRVINSKFRSAVEDGLIDVMEVLFAKTSFEMEDVLTHAVEKAPLKVMKVLLALYQERESTDARFNKTIASVLDIAASDDNIEMATLLVSKCRNFDGCRALNYAVKNSNLEMVELLVEKSALVSKVDALICAAVHEELNILEVLLAHSNHDSMQLALPQIEVDGITDVSKLILEKSDHEVQRLIFAEAAAKCFMVPIRKLLDQMDSCSMARALTCSAARGHIDVVKVLLEKGDPTSINYALLAATMEGRVGVVELLRGHCDAVAGRQEGLSDVKMLSNLQSARNLK